MSERVTDQPKTAKDRRLFLASSAIVLILLISLVSIPGFILALGVLQIMGAVCRIYPTTHGLEIRWFFSSTISLPGLASGMLLIGLSIAAFVGGITGIAQIVL